MVYTRYHAQRAERIAAERALMAQELREIRGEVPAAQVAAKLEQPAPAPQQLQRADKQRR